MTKTKWNPEIDRAVSDISTNKILRHTCQFFAPNKKTKNSELTPYGSGVFVEVLGEHFIITASHVAEYLYEDQLFIRINKTKYVSVVGEVATSAIDSQERVDLAIIKIDSRILPDLLRPYIFLPLEKFRSHNLLPDVTQYCIIGYPEVNQKRENGILETGAEAFYTVASKANVYEYYKLNPQHVYALTLQRKGISLESGDKVKVNTKVHGMSGCGLWLLIPSLEDEVYSVDYRLIGIMTEYRQGKYFCLIGNKISLVISALREIVGLPIVDVRIPRDL